MTACCLIADEGLARLAVADAVQLAVVVMIGVVTYFMATMWRNQVGINDIANLIPRLWRGRVGSLLNWSSAVFHRSG